MKNLKKQYNQTPNDVVFNFNNLSEDEDILLAIIIITLIKNGFDYEDILKPLKNIVNVQERFLLKKKIIKILKLLNFNRQ